MAERRRDFPSHLKREVRAEQDYRCGYCQAPCRGHPDDPTLPALEVHHIVPQSEHGPCTRLNAVGLCGKSGHSEGCHCLFDRLYFEQGKTFIDVVMEEGRWYELKRLGLRK